jgi:transposase InsO family protein
MCALLGVSVSGYYAWRKRTPSALAQANQALLVKIREIHRNSRKTYGSQRIHAVLRRQGVQCGQNRVARLMSQHQIYARRKRHRKFTTQSQHGFPKAPNILAQNFEAQAPNQKWVSDISYVATEEGWLYLAVIMDLFSRRIVGWAMARTLSDELTRSALRMALEQRKPKPGLLHHSDQGRQYASHAYRQLLAAYKIMVSMSRKGNCYDNAPIESFFSTLKNEHIHFQKYQTRNEAKTDVFVYIEGFYNRQRLHSSLDYWSPVQFERNYLKLLN